MQAEVDSMKEGTAKKLAQIDLDYQKRARAIQEAEERIRELQSGELTKGQQAQIKALNDANNAQRTEERASVSSISISPEGLASTINKNIQYWDEYLQNMEPSGKNYKLQKTFTTVKSKRLAALESGRHLKPSEMQQ